MIKKNIWFGILFLITGGITYFVANTWFNSEELIEVKVDRTIIDIGRVKRTDSSIAIFNLSNEGSNNILIDKITSDCHCTIPTWRKSLIGKGETFKIELVYDNHLLGFFEQKAKVYFKNSKSPPLLLIMRGTVIE